MASATPTGPAADAVSAGSPPVSSSPADLHKRRVNPFVLYSAVVLMLLLWVMNYLVGKEGFKQIDSFSLALFRVEAATLILVPIYFLGRPKKARPPISRRDYLYFVTLAVLGICCNQIFWTIGLDLTTVAHSALIVAVGPVNILLLARLLGMEKLSTPKVAGIAIAFAGVLVLALEHGLGRNGATLRGDLFTLTASLGFTGYTVLGKRVAGRYSSLQLNAYTYLAAGLILSPLAVWKGIHLHWREIGFQGWWAVFYMAVGSSVIAYLMWFWALKHLAASRLGVFTFLQPILGTLLGVYVLGEPFTRQLGLAGLLVLGGVLLTEWHPARMADDEDESAEEAAPAA